MLRMMFSLQGIFALSFDNSSVQLDSNFTIFWDDFYFLGGSSSVQLDALRMIENHVEFKNSSG
jgi:hypothetical protein